MSQIQASHMANLNVRQCTGLPYMCLISIQAFACMDFVLSLGLSQHGACTIYSGIIAAKSLVSQSCETTTD